MNDSMAHWEPYSIQNLFEALAGTWILQRQLPLGGSMIGLVVFHKKGSEQFYHYQEKGKRVMGLNRTYTAYNEYGYMINNNHEIHIHRWNLDIQAPGPLMHILCFSTSIQEKGGPLYAEHTYQCGADFYRLVYTFIHPMEIHYTYFIQGPSKDYMIQTKLRRKPT
jgi:hypothetical protein